MRNITFWNNALSPWRGFVDVQRDFDQLFESFAGQHKNLATIQPAVDVEQSETAYFVRVDLPGVSKKDINIEVKDNYLIISGERKFEKKTEGTSERFQGKFQRVVALPESVDHSKIEASLESGVLTVGLPKSEEKKPRQIEISEGKTPLAPANVA